MQQIKDALTEIVREFVPKEMFADEQNWDRTLTQLGIDSLDVMTVFLNVQEKFELVDIPEEEIDKLNTFNLIAEYIKCEVDKKTSA